MGNLRCFMAKKKEPTPDPKDIYEIGNSCYLCDSIVGSNSTCTHCVNYGNIDKQLTAKEKLAKARKYTLEELTAQMKPEHNIPELIKGTVGKESLDPYMLSNTRLTEEDLQRLLTKEELEYLNLADVCENCVGTTESGCDNCIYTYETECIDCGRKFKCQPLVDGQCHSCFNTQVNDKDLSGKAPLELVPIEFLEYPAAPLQVGLLKGYSSGSWKAHLPRSKWIAAAIRHLIAYEKGENGDRGIYTEYHPKTGEPISVSGEHIKAAIFNLCRVQWSIEHGKEDEDDR